LRKAVSPPRAHPRAYRLGLAGQGLADSHLWG